MHRFLIKGISEDLIRFFLDNESFEKFANTKIDRVLSSKNPIKLQTNYFILLSKVSHQFIFRYLVKVTKNEKISCPVYLLFTEKVNFLLVNKEKFLS